VGTCPSLGADNRRLSLLGRKESLATLEHLLSLLQQTTTVGAEMAGDCHQAITHLLDVSAAFNQGTGRDRGACPLSCAHHQPPQHGGMGCEAVTHWCVCDPHVQVESWLLSALRWPPSLFCRLQDECGDNKEHSPYDTNDPLIAQTLGRPRSDHPAHSLGLLTPPDSRCMHGVWRWLPPVLWLHP
jgi:hypothetical protein